MPERNDLAKPVLEMDSNGNVVTRPVTGWSVLTLAGMSVLAAIQYAQTPQELETGNSKQIQLVLMPQQCVELAQALKKAGKSLLEDRSDSQRPAN